MYVAALVDELIRTPGVRLAGYSWSLWESWSACSQECAKGYRSRKRTCAAMDGKSTPNACRGTPVEYQDCNPQPCPGNTLTYTHAQIWTHRHRSSKCFLHFPSLSVRLVKQLLSPSVLLRFIS